MRCPLCDRASLSRKELEEYLAVKECNKCGGYWISADVYWKWLKKHGRTFPEKPFSEVINTLEDSQKAKICPDCGHILIKYRVGHGISFYLDHCNNCNGVWFDKNEWETLKSRNLHDDIHSIFTTPWQEKVRKEESSKRLEKIYAEKFGDDYAEIKKIKKWLDEHPRKSTILAYFNDPNPYKI